MQIVPAFITGIVVALMSSVPVGPINFAIMQTVLSSGKRLALMIGIGGAIADAVYCFLALIVFGWIAGDQNPAIFAWLNLLTIPVLFFLGIRMIKRRNDPPQQVKTGKGSGIFMGIALGISNPVLFGYWLWAITTLQSEGFIGQGWGVYIAFTLGVSMGILGFFLLLVNLIALGSKKLSDGFRRFFSTAVGIGFMVFGTYLALRFAIDTWLWD